MRSGRHFQPGKHTIAVNYVLTDLDVRGVCLRTFAEPMSAASSLIRSASISA
jgi:hypothetical protein